MSADEAHPHLALMTNSSATNRTLDKDGTCVKVNQPVGAESSSGRCHLLALPTEIRVEIYRHLFKGSEVWARQCPTCCSRYFCRCDFPWQVASTSQQLREETIPYLLSATTLQIQDLTNAVHKLPPALVSAIPRVVVRDTEGFRRREPLHLEPFHSLKTLEIRNITVWCKYHDDAYLQGAEGDDCMIQLALSNLRRIHPDLRRICAASERCYEMLLECQYVVSSSTHETISAVINIDNETVLRKFKGPANHDRNAWAGFY